ncbi:hypothetical protein PTTG_30037 [Puccinia triticina 1-1 BBBD Race 1]|uniref:Uncharacterized protein n=1 Tax=Puccinia triticina (isolate 1-1 / race 1 (BBBD)) TaxID=630390 RepID=A0A180G0R1_PUCT1|nr:hypothetical protein PTTG_30037 [Puccinia triticina 1-1 BBBD Race 1]
MSTAPSKITYAGAVRSTTPTSDPAPTIAKPTVRKVPTAASESSRTVTAPKKPKVVRKPILLSRETSQRRIQTLDINTREATKDKEIEGPTEVVPSRTCLTRTLRQIHPTGEVDAGSLIRDRSTTR